MNNKVNLMLSKLAHTSCTFPREKGFLSCFLISAGGVAMETETSPPSIIWVVRTATSNLHIWLHFCYKFALLLFVCLFVFNLHRLVNKE